MDYTGFECRHSCDTQCGDVDYYNRPDQTLFGSHCLEVCTTIIKVSDVASYYQSSEMICILSLIVFSFLGIFSATHRELARESFVCLKNRAKRQPCETGLDEKVQASVVGKVLEYNPSMARVLNKYFELFSWVALILLIVSGLTLSMGVYNYAVHGNCNGPDSVESCTANQIEEGILGLGEDKTDANKTRSTSENLTENRTERVPEK